MEGDGFGLRVTKVDNNFVSDVGVDSPLRPSLKVRFILWKFLAGLLLFLYLVEFGFAL